MKHLPFDTAHQWLTRLAACPGPLPFNQIPAIAAELGWEPGELANEYLHHHGSDSPLISASGNSDTNELHSVSFTLVYNLNNDLAGNILIADLYTDYINATTRAWGPATDHTTDATAAIWKLHDHAYINISAWPNTILCRFETVDPNGLG